MGERHIIGELDLLAYADDPLGLEPQRRAAVELHLSRHPEDAARVEAFRRQDAALRERYEPYARAPVPQRLYDALNHAPEPAGHRCARYAAAATIIVATAAAGWVAGDRFGGSTLVAVSEQPLTSEQLTNADDSQMAQPLTPEPVSVAGILEYGATLPDLGHLGFSLVSTEPVSDSSEAVRLSYARGDGQAFTLLLRSRWHHRDPGFQVHKQGETSVVSWEEGRLAAELTSDVGRDEALDIAEAVRNALKTFGPASPLPAAGTLAVGAPALPQQVQ